MAIPRASQIQREFANLANMCSISGMESQMAQQIKEILRANPGPPTQWGTRDDDTNTHCLASHHIESATFLPVGHPVRRAVAAASVEGYLGNDTHKFVGETRDYPEFAADLLQELRGTLNEMKFDKRGAFFQDPISGQELRFGRLCRKRKAPMAEDPST
ncbi:hypothetical protein N7474_007678 [Penicillium riverlandense]|uniref:uncharacterized protein n=1 Tax=Penicillium riverlandense TaxID=1903569 RepID=UPI0025483F40|nr:uncharacterized protein N7474_007678 [Penicillium riverlandense]KAJ5811377.1 hypothetical protein N7474_007678 [Penicillium riverlandense]